MFPVKLSFNGEVRRVTLAKLNFESLNEAVNNLFPALRGKAMTFMWSDDESDLVCCSTDDEVQEAIRIMNAESKTAYRFDVTLKSPASPASAPARQSVTHFCVTCDGCGLRPIVGVRYKCTVRNDFDLCEGCEGATPQPYPMIKIYDPRHAPVAIMVAINGEPAGGAQPQCGRGGRGQNGGRRGCQKFFEALVGKPEDGSQQYCRLEKKVRRLLNKNPTCLQQLKEQFPHVADTIQAIIDRLQAEVPSAQATSVPQDDNRQCEEQLVAEAVRISLGEGESECEPVCAVPVDEKPVVEDCAEVVKAANAELDIASQAVALPPAMKFIGDVTFPDGSTVAADTVVSKVWRIRNDGSDWNAGDIVLVCCGGDAFTMAEFVTLPMPLPAVTAGEVFDVSLSVLTPAIAGRHVAYFRLARASDGQQFGQRLWLDVKVNEEEEGWHVVAGGSPAASDSSPASSALIEDNGPVEEEVANSAVPEVSVPDEVFAPQVCLWEHELNHLAEMGFNNRELLIPLLERHVGVHSSQEARQQGLAHVVTELF